MKLNDNFETRLYFDRKIAQLARDAKALAAEFGANPHFIVDTVKQEVTLPLSPASYGRKASRPFV